MRVVRNVAGVAVFLLIWEIFGRSGVLLQESFPPPSIVAGTLVDLFGNAEFVKNLVATLLAWAVAFGIAIAVAVPAGLLLGTVRLIRIATRSVVEFLRPIPAIAWLPLALATLGSGPETKITLAVYSAVWPMLFNVIYALGEVDRQYVDTARSFGLNRFQIVTRVKVPDILPFALTGLRLSATVALLVVVSTELVAGGVIGLGTYVMSNADTGRVDIVMAGAVIAGVLGYAINGIIAAAQKRLVPWSPGGSTR